MNRKTSALSLALLLLPLFRGAAQSPPPGAGDTGVVVEEPEETVVLDNETWMEREEARQFQIEGTEIFTYPETLNCGNVLKNLTLPAGARIIIPIEADERLLRMVLSMEGGQGDADMYLSYGEVPGLHSYQFRPYVNGNTEELQLKNPKPGRWFLMLHAYRAFSGVSVTLNCVKSLEDSVESDIHAEQDIELALYYELSGEAKPDEVRNVSLQTQLLNRQGREAFDAGRYNEAKTIWEEWMELDPENPRPVTLLGDLHLRLEELDKAIEYYRNSLKMQPGQIGLMGRLSRILDEKMDSPEEAKELLNHFSELFPKSGGVALAQAEWLIRRNRFEEAVNIITKVVEEDPENLNAMSLLHPLLRSQEAKYDNMRRMLKIGRMPGREINLGYAIKNNDLLSRLESWVLMEFIYRMAGEAPSVEQRKLFEDLLPRDSISVEDFRIGRMSNNWTASHQESFGDGGSLILRAEASQAEAFLRLNRSDAMHNGFVEAWVDDSRGYFWIYARRGQGNMVRFGFAENGQLYLQVWMNNHLVHNQSRIWSRLPGDAVLRLKIHGDGAMGYLNGEPAFNAPVSIPAEMGLGWWGIAPWSPSLGTASVTVSKVAGGPLPVRLGLIPKEEFHPPGTEFAHSISGTLTDLAGSLSTLAPEWYSQNDRGEASRLDFQENQELRLMARYYRIRLLPMLKVRSYRALDLQKLIRFALEDRSDGLTLVVERMPEPEWVDQAEKLISDAGLTLHLVLLDTKTGKASFREICSNVGVFPGPRQMKTLALYSSDEIGEAALEDTAPDSVLYMENIYERRRP